MGQMWTVLSLDTRTRSCQAKLGEHFWERLGEHMVHLFAKSEVSLQFVPSRKQKSSATAIQQYSPILKLPTEILVQIFEELCGESCLVLTMTCRRLWDIGWDILERIFQEWFRSWTWAGSRIIFLGEYCERNELPHGLLTIVEEKELENGFSQDELDEFVEMDDLWEGHGIEPSVPISLNDLGFFRYPQVKLGITPRSQGLNYDTCHLYQVPEAQRDFVMDFLFTEMEHFPSKEIWILRNLSAKEYVRGDYLYSSF